MGFPKWLPLMMANDYLIPLDHSQLPNFAANAASKYQDPAYDPGNRFSIPYMSGITGIGYDPELTGREITSVLDLFDPAFEGKVGMFGDTEDMPNLTLLGMGVEPSESTEDDWQAAADKLTKQRTTSLVRQYFGQNYVNALTSGNVALTMAWSADVLQLQMSGFPNLKFVVPDEGAMLWTDSLCIPTFAEHPLDALTFMDFIYRPDVAAMIVGWIQNVSPVPNSQDVLRQEGNRSRRARSCSPRPRCTAGCTATGVLTPSEQQVWDQLFQPIFQGRPADDRPRRLGGDRRLSRSATDTCGWRDATRWSSRGRSARRSTWSPRISCGATSVGPSPRSAPRGRRATSCCSRRSRRTTPGAAAHPDPGGDRLRHVRPRRAGGGAADRRAAGDRSR